MSVTPEFLPAAPRAASRKNVWSFEQIIPDPHKANHVYAIQILEGHFEEGSKEFHKALKHKTRVIYAKMTESGKLQNVYGGVEED